MPEKNAGFALYWILIHAMTVYRSVDWSRRSNPIRAVVDELCWILQQLA
jgi:hypothetical protein